MAKFRINHNKGKTSGNMIRFSIYAVILLGLLWFGLDKIISGDSSRNQISDQNQVFYLPEGKNEIVVNHSAFTLSYLEEHEVAEWVAYTLTRELLKIPNVERAREYKPDPKIYSKSAIHSDYTRSGYTRGHLAPAGDMAHSKVTMEESFYMSNITPQKRVFNNGIWKELEENIREWAYEKGELIIITGPVIHHSEKKIGKNKVSVPTQFYKVIFDNEQEEMIGFIIPNEKSELHLKEYAVSVDSIENVTRIDFFKNYLDDDVEEELESSLNLDPWDFSEKKYYDRINKWNYQ